MIGQDSSPLSGLFGGGFQNRVGIAVVVGGIVTGLVALSTAASLIYAICLGLLFLAVWLAASTDRWLFVFVGLLGVVPALELASLDGAVAVSDLLLPLGAVLLVLRWRQPDHYRFSFLPWLFLGLLVTQVLSVVLTEAPVSIMLPSILRSVRSIGVVLVLLFMSSARWGTRRVDTFEAWIVLVALMSNALTILQFVFQWDFFIRSEQYAWYNGIRVMRGSGIFGEANYAGAFAALSAILAVGLLDYYERGNWRRHLAVMCFAVALPALILTSSRGALLNLSVGLVLLFFKLSRKTRRTLLVAGGIATVSVALVSPEFATYAIERIISTLFGLQSDADAILGGRLTSWAALLSLVETSPLLGVGYRLVPLVGQRLNLITSDNNIIMALVETGVVGFVFTVVILGYCLMRSVQLLRQHRVGASAVGAAVCGFIAQGFSVDSLTYWRIVPILLGLMQLEVSLVGRKGEASSNGTTAHHPMR